MTASRIAAPRLYRARAILEAGAPLGAGISSMATNASLTGWGVTLMGREQYVQHKQR